MARPFDFGEIKLSAGGEDSSALPNEDTPFRIAVLGDFSGRPSRGLAETGLANRRTLLIDRDNFDERQRQHGNVSDCKPVRGTTHSAGFLRRRRKLQH